MTTATLYESVISNRGRTVHVIEVPFLLPSAMRGYVTTVCGTRIPTAIRLTAPELRTLERDDDEVRRCGKCFGQAWPTNMERI